jgi:hypothetical protein
MAPKSDISLSLLGFWCIHGVNARRRFNRLNPSALFDLRVTSPTSHYKSKAECADKGRDLGTERILYSSIYFYLMSHTDGDLLMLPWTRVQYNCHLNLQQI